jgi:uncharacterized protein (TIGR01777 family)
VKRVLVTGGSGFIGRRLVQDLLERGDQVTVLTRDVRAARARLPAGVRVAAWNPLKEGPWFDELKVVDAVVHLAGEGVVRKWTDEAKRAIEQSRVDSTKLVVQAIAAAKDKPKALVSASATGYYGPHAPSDELTEDSPPGNDFLAGVTSRWEEAAREVETHGVRAVQLRIGVVLGEGGGALEQMVKPFRFFMGGPVGDGSQIVSWVHRDDVVGMTAFAIDREEAKGPMNAVSPFPVQARDLADALGVVLNRPSWFRAPEGMLRLRFGEAASILLTGQRVVPKKAIELGYEFRHARLMPALESILAA